MNGPTLFVIVKGSSVYVTGQPREDAAEVHLAPGAQPWACDWDVVVPVQPSQPCSRAAETQAVGQKVACDKVVSGATRSHAAAWCLWPTLCSEETVLDPNTEGAKRDVMLPVTHVLALGTWLVSQSEATPSAPTISIFQKPPGVIPPGGSITISCICQRSYGSFVLYKGSRRLLEQSGSRAEFSISHATYKDRGSYNCHYLEGGTVLARSTELEVLVEELRLPRPNLSVLPGQRVTPGADVKFRCTTTHPSTGCYLYLEGQIRAQLLPRERGDYNLSLVQEGDSGRYSCQCYTFSASIEWSAVSNTLDLVVRDYTLCNTVRLALAAGLLLLLGLITAEAARSRCCRGWGNCPLPAGSAAPPGTAAGPPRLFPCSHPRRDE
ncbi:osteoclast-associated immunoglobulin-like receptor [Vidua chalybeata]|uniref:osteoclast-associated immunoglobulin-like receptor n=1 Tax=Vidua chalybeata TaxID=81927 RepID=UPI0023A795D8|nr:osteoclast-associated immunoglobulin-like receptor [Vidua chalybeata]